MIIALLLIISLGCEAFKGFLQSPISLSTCLRNSNAIDTNEIIEKYVEKPVEGNPKGELQESHAFGIAGLYKRLFLFLSEKKGSGFRCRVKAYARNFVSEVYDTKKQAEAHAANLALSYLRQKDNKCEDALEESSYQLDVPKTLSRKQKEAFDQLSTELDDTVPRLMPSSVRELIKRTKVFGLGLSDGSEMSKYVLNEICKMIAVQHITPMYYDALRTAANAYFNMFAAELLLSNLFTSGDFDPLAFLPHEIYKRESDEVYTVFPFDIATQAEAYDNPLRNALIFDEIVSYEKLSASLCSTAKDGLLKTTLYWALHTNDEKTALYLLYKLFQG